MMPSVSGGLRSASFRPIEVDGEPMTDMVAGLVGSWIVDGLVLLVLIVIAALLFSLRRQVSRLTPPAHVRRAEVPAAGDDARSPSP